MELSYIIMWVGFFLAAFSVVGNDVIQTLGTFITSNEKRQPWWLLFLFTGSILVAALTYGYINSDISYGRLAKFTMPETYQWYYLLPPIVLLIITRSGIPVSTTFMILTLFSLQDIPVEFSPMLSSVVDTDQQLGGMIYKSIMGYVVAFVSSIAIYLAVTKITEEHFIQTSLKGSHEPYWIVAQWATSGFLWFQWLTQDLANIYIFLRGGNDLSLVGFIFSVIIIVGLLGVIFYLKGGAIQDVVRAKTNTADIRSATIVDFIYAIILYIFKYDYFDIWGGKIPMSTTWIFIGLLAGREIGIRLWVKGKINSKTATNLFSDLGKVFFGLLISVLLVFAIKYLSVTI